jgi:hypothetical protein
MRVVHSPCMATFPIQHTSALYASVLSQDAKLRSNPGANSIGKKLMTLLLGALVRLLLLHLMLRARP